MTQPASAVQKFSQQFPGVVKSSLMTKAAMAAASQELAADLIQAGVPREHLQPWIEDPEKMVQLHRVARQHGKPGLRTYEQILTSTGQRLSREFGIPAGGGPSTSQQRLERKRAAPSQPRSAGVRGGMTATARPKTAADVIQDVRRQRGFTPSR